MDNGTLVFIIIIEAMIIAWQASKLKQFSKFEKILSADTHAAERVVPADAVGVSSASTAAASSPQPESTRADSASRAVASALSVGAGTDGDIDNIDEQILDSAGIDPEANIEEAKRVQLVMARCRYAEFYLEQLDDDYERGQFQRIINSCKSTARNIEDPFFRASALQSVILLLDRAEWHNERDELLAEVDDKLMRQRIAEELAQSAEVSA